MLSLNLSYKLCHSFYGLRIPNIHLITQPLTQQLTKLPYANISLANICYGLCLLCACLIFSPASHAEFDPIMAAATNEGSEPVQAPVGQAVTDTRLDPIQTFALADFEQKKQLLTNWTYDAKSFDTLMQLINADELYRDADNQVFLLKNDTDLVDYTSQTSLGDNWPATLEQVTLNNELRAALNIATAKKDLASDDLQTRLAAITLLAENPTDVSEAFVSEQLSLQTDPKIKTALTTLLARKQLQDSASTDAVKTQAAAVLADSDDPSVLALLDKTLADNSLTPAVKQAVSKAHTQVNSRIESLTWLGHVFSGLSVASILLLAALGLAITYGLLGVINMAHGELIMVGAYATYVTQQLFATYLPSAMNWYMLAAIPVAFLVSGLVGVIIERVVVKPLYGRQLETLLATFGVSLVLIQLTRMLFGAQNVAIEASSWLSGGVHLSSSLILPYNRIAVIGFTLVVLLAVKLLISYTRFGLFVRAVTQNRPMARAVGVNSSKIDMLAFGLGSGVAGLAGCALAQIGNVGPDLGQSLIVDTFLVVVVGGVGQLAGAALAALGLGVGGTALEVGIGAVLAKIVLLVLVILFIQKRPQGLFAVKGRFVE